MLGVGLTLMAHGHVGIYVDGVSVWVTAAFVGVALSITAFPMLARIITERGLAGSRFGSSPWRPAPPTTPSPGSCSPGC